MKTRSQGSFPKPLATTTVHQCRGGPFLPVGQVPPGFKGRDFIFENQWGRCMIRKCALTQTHQDIIDVIRKNAVLTKTAPDGQVLVVFSPYTILKALRDKGTNHSWLNEKIEELETVRIDTEVRGWRVTSGIVRKHAKSLLDNGEAQRRGGIAKDAKYWYVIFEAEYCKFFLFDVKLHYQELLPRIIDLKKAVTKALVRFCLSHDQINMALTDILIALGAIRQETPLRTRQHISRQVRDEAEALEQDFGIVIRKMEDGREGVFYKKHPKVRFESPEKIAISRPPVIDAPENESGQRGAMV